MYSFDTVPLRHEFTKSPDKVWDALGRPALYHRFAGTNVVLTAFECTVDPKRYKTVVESDWPVTRDVFSGSATPAVCCG